jgi:hypothetical protein
MPSSYRSPRRPPPDSFELYVCRACRAWDLAPEMTHNGYCPGRTDPAHIDRVIAKPVRVEPNVRDRG